MSEVIAELLGVTFCYRSWRYGCRVALEGVSFAVRQGTITALLGPNGAGKTTAIEVLAGKRKPDAGAVTVFGGDPRNVASRIGLTELENRTPRSTVRQYIERARRRYMRPAGFDEIIARAGLQGLEDEGVLWEGTAITGNVPGLRRRWRGMRTCLFSMSRIQGTRGNHRYFAACDDVFAR